MTLVATLSSPPPHFKDRTTENFPVGSVLIRRDLRPHIHAFYNFARAADDISDDPLMEPEQKLKKLQVFSDELVATGSCTHEAIGAMRLSLAATGVSPQHCLDLLTAFKRDATDLRYETWAELMDYCRYSASPVGRHVLALHGIGETAWIANDALCSGLQIINHIQDCADDYRELDRVYLPHDMLRVAGSSSADLSRPEASPGLRSTLSAMLDRLDGLMVQGRTLPRYVPDWRLKCETSVIASLADRLIALLRKRDPLCDNVKLGKASVGSAVMIGIVRAWL